MDRVTLFAVLLQPLAITMTVPMFHNFVSILNRLGIRQAANGDWNER